MSTSIKPTLSNIISLWFGVDSPLRQYRIQCNPMLWGACQRTSQTFKPATHTKLIEHYRSADKAAFARAVQQEIERSQSLREKPALQIA